MPQLIVIFLLFFAVLAFGWFYWQRAKARDVAQASDATATTAAAEAPASTDVTESDVATTSTPGSSEQS